MNVPKAVKRSACDRCRAKRIRCPRAESSSAPCSRCVQVGASCVTSSPGVPGRPRKAHSVKPVTPGGLAVTPSGVSLSEYWSPPWVSDESRSRVPTANNSMSMDTPWFGADTASLNLLGDLGGGALMLSKPTVPPLKDSSSQDHSDGWTAPGAMNMFGFPLTEESPASDSISPLNSLNTPSQHQELVSAGDGLEMMYVAQQPEDMVEAASSPGRSECLSGRGPGHRESAASSLMQFGEKIERHVSAMSAFLSNPRNIVQDCQEKDAMSMSTENPVAVVLMCTKEFIEIIQDLTTTPQSATSGSSDVGRLVPSEVSSPTAETKSLSTETTLLLLSSYLGLMRLYDSLFRDVYRTLSQMPSETIKSIKLKSVFRIGGMSSLQDMSAKAYALGIVDVIQRHIQTMERCMGLPAEYCLSGEVASSHRTTGIFATEDRSRLLQAVMMQNDVKSQRGDKTYVESIRENIKNSLAVFGS